MCHKRLFVLINGLMLILITTAACSTPQSTPTPLPPTKTPTMIPFEAAIEWDYVALGDSITFEMIYLYAAILEQDLGVKIELHGWSVGDDHSSSFLERLQSDERLRQDQHETEVITFEIPIKGWEYAIRKFENGSPGACGGVDNQDCLREILDIYITDTEEIIAEIVSLRSPSEALIRKQDIYQPRIGESREAGTFEIINRYWRKATEHLLEVAINTSIPVARVYDAFMGEDGAEDPREKGLLITDGIHPNPEGSVLLAELFRELGYEYSPYTP